MRSPFDLFILLLCSCFSQAQQLPGYFADHMVLQRHQPIRIWGWAKAGERISVELGQQKAQTRVDGNGNWTVLLKPLPAGGPYELKVTGKQSLIVRDVMLGDVWFCSGQSNMEWPMRATDISSAQLQQLANNHIRVLTVPHRMASTAQTHIPGLLWRSATVQDLPDFSAVATYFAHHLQQHTGIPIGLVVSAWGGTDIEPWMSPKALSVLEKHAGGLEKLSRIGEPDAFDARTKKQQAAWNDTLETYDKGLLEKW